MKRINLYSAVLVLSFLVLFNISSYATRYSIDVKNYEFSPSNLTSVKIGDTIHFEWKTGSHTTTSTSVPVGASMWDQVMDATHLTYNYIPMVTGVYHYKCTPHESMGMVGQFTVLSAAGIAENTMLPRITVFPNPARDKVFLKCVLKDGIVINRLVIYDATGKKIRESLFSERELLPDYIDLSGIPEGILLMEFVDNQNRSVIVRAFRRN